ncbi:septum formation family protein [Hamadaea tsunoensis]|uniref:septum formation family protein n=1 Tax=Hamadaea tsunoensis TaxID=53368 RepID=UPI000418C527|nr:septum formation family protein [Hamadaea tsunoensis]
MRRWISAAALLGAVAFVAAGCGLPAGVDGKLADGWAPIAAPQGFTPDAGTCHASFEETGYLSSYNPIDCGQSHKTETVFVGQLTTASVPAAGSADRVKAFQECQGKVNEFLGAEWHDGRVWIGLTFPSDAAWSGGAHWYRCEVSELEEVFGDDVARTGSLKGELAKPGSAVHLGCFNYASGGDLKPIACASKHNAEYVGSIAISSQAQSANRDTMITNCRKQIAAYAKMKYSSDMRYRVGEFWDPVSVTEFNGGDRRVRCYAWFSPDTKTKSIKGAGAGALPIHYA